MRDGLRQVNLELHALPSRVAAAMNDFRPDWLIAGGWAIDLFLGEVTRPHDDVEIAVFRKDQVALHDSLNGWLLQKVVGGELSAWHRGEWLGPPVHEIHCFNEAAELRRFEVLLNETSGGEWVYRRNEKVRRPLSELQLLSSAGVKFLAPEVALLYKSKNPRDKDEQDFAAAVGRLDAARRRWLRGAIAACHSGHHWLQRL